MAKNKSNFSLRDSLSNIIQKIHLDEPSRHSFLEQRWLRQTLWYERMAVLERRLYYFLRITTILGSVIVPAVIGLNINNEKLKKEHLAWIAFGIGQTVAIAAALEEFISPAEKLKDYRQSSEDMQREGWHFLQLSGPYREFKNHDAAYKTFAERVEAIIEKNVSERLNLLEAQVAEAAEARAKENEKLTEALNQSLEQVKQATEELQRQKQLILSDRGAAPDSRTELISQERRTLTVEVEREVPRGHSIVSNSTISSSTVPFNNSQPSNGSNAQAASPSVPTEGRRRLGEKALQWKE